MQPKAFDWDAGMHDIKNAAGFIKANMTLGSSGTLTDQDAWDVATFAGCHERPQDSRFAKWVQETRSEYHDGAMSMYGKTMNGAALGRNE